tara:strand:+ start:7133 stop:7831 length:699 start_codon:yes stop_codon:yes gene_type:complete
MNIQKVEVHKRENSGRGHCRRLRKSGRIPIVFYSKSRNETFSVAEPDFREIVKSAGASIVELDSGDGEASLALIKEVQRDPCTDMILHIDFVEVTRGEELQAKVPLVFIGEATGVKLEGGILDIMVREIEVRCRPSLLPPSIDIDVSELAMGDSLHVSALPTLEGVAYLSDPDLTLISCVGTASGRADLEDEDLDEEGEGAEGEGAEGEGAEDEGEEGEDKSPADATNSGDE